MPARSVCCIKAGSRLLFEVETAVHRAADVHQQAEVQRKIGLAAEIQNRLRRLVIVENAEIVLIQIAYKLAVLVGRDKEDVHFIHAGVQRNQRVLRFVDIIRCRRIGRAQARRAGHVRRLRPQLGLSPKRLPGKALKARKSSSCTSCPVNPIFSL